jgi:hypothetical protein
LRRAIFFRDDKCRQKLASQLAPDQSTHQESKRALPYLSRASPGESQPGKKMEYTQHHDEVSIYQSNFRAEDGLNPSNALYEGVVIPLASLFAVILFVIGAMMLSN